MFQLKEKVCMVTGGSRGIGRAMVNKFYSEGAKVMICDVTAPEDKADLPSNLAFVTCDVSDKKSFENAFLVTSEKFGKVDVLVNNAGVLKEAKYEELIHINLLGVMHGTKLAMKYLSREGGLVINVGSCAGLLPFPVAPSYAASKAAIIHYTRCFGSDFYFSECSIRFICICPSFVLTSMIDSKFLNPEDEALYPHLKEIVEDAITNKNYLLPETLAEDLAEILPTAENGSVWIFKHGCKPEVVPLPALCI